MGKDTTCPMCGEKCYRLLLNRCVSCNDKIDKRNKNYRNAAKDLYEALVYAREIIKAIAPDLDGPNSVIDKALKKAEKGE